VFAITISTLLNPISTCNWIKRIRILEYKFEYSNSIRYSKIWIFGYSFASLHTMQSILLQYFIGDNASIMSAWCWTWWNLIGHNENVMKMNLHTNYSIRRMAPYSVMLSQCWVSTGHDKHSSSVMRPNENRMYRISGTWYLGSSTLPYYFLLSTLTILYSILSNSINLFLIKFYLMNYLLISLTIICLQKTPLSAKQLSFTWASENKLIKFKDLNFYSESATLTASLTRARFYIE